MFVRRPSVVACLLFVHAKSMRSNDASYDSDERATGSRGGGESRPNVLARVAAKPSQLESPGKDEEQPYARLPIEAYLRCQSPHHRTDHHPLITGKSHETDASIKQVESKMVGHGLWKRYDETDIPSHAGIRGLAALKDVLSQKSAGRNTTEIASDSTGRKLIMTASKPAGGADTLRAALSMIAQQGGVEKCQHDVYAAVPLGRKHSVFSPGLNQLWLVLAADRRAVLLSIVVAAAADSEPASVYVGAGEGLPDLTTIGLQFDSFSGKENPMDWSLHLGRSTGIPGLRLDLYHAREFTGVRPHDAAEAHYLTVTFECEAAPEAYRERWIKDAAYAWLPGLFHPAASYFRELFLVKALQIFDLCHCYRYTPGGLVDCVEISGDIPEGATPQGGVWRTAAKYVLDAVRVARNLVQDVDDAHWVVKPLITYESGEVVECWAHYRRGGAGSAPKQLPGSDAPRYSAGPVAGMLDGDAADGLADA